jgi:branched-chain amino acid transport system ATP-binding protein
MFPILKERRKQLAGSLSGGEQQMLAIGRGLMSKPRLLMLDEPSNGLAPAFVEKIFETVKTVNDAGVAVLLVEQNVSKSLEIADKAFVMENGSIVLQGTGQELLNNERVKRAYLGL